MKVNFFIGAALAAVTVAAVSGANAQNLIQNSGFEVNTSGLQNGNNIGVAPFAWFVTNGTSNLQQGTSNGDGGVFLSPYDAAFSGGSDGAAGGTHFFDGTHFNEGTRDPTTISQAFSISSASSLTGSFALGVRDAGGGSASTILTIASTSASSSFTPFTFTGVSTVEGAWRLNTFNVSAVPAGNYTLSFNLPDSQNLDAVRLSTVPEPSTWVMVAGALGVLLLVRRPVRRMA